jgi:hypothetical protein
MPTSPDKSPGLEERRNLGSEAALSERSEFSRFPKFRVPQMLTAKRAGARVAWALRRSSARTCTLKRPQSATLTIAAPAIFYWARSLKHLQESA